MLVAGIRTLGGPVEAIEVTDPRPLAPDEVLIDVRGAGVDNWDEVVRTDGWNVGVRPPMALGVEAAGVISAVGAEVTGFGVGDQVLCHPVPLRAQGSWAPLLIAPVEALASKPPDVSWEVAAVFAVPALTAEQVLSEALTALSTWAAAVAGMIGGLVG